MPRTLDTEYVQYLRQIQGARWDLDKLNRIRAREQREIKQGAAALRPNLILLSTSTHQRRPSLAIGVGIVIRILSMQG